MKHLTNPTAPRFLLWTILCIFLLAIAGPGTILAGGIEYTSGSGMVEGDPGDGLEYSGGGGGSDKVEDMGFVNYDPNDPREVSITLPLAWTYGVMIIFEDPNNGFWISGKLILPIFGEVFE